MSIEAVALELLSWLITKFGPQTVMAIFGIKTGSAVGEVVSDAGNFISEVLDAIRTPRGPLADDQIKTVLDAQYVAADKLADTFENSKFPKK